VSTNSFDEKRRRDYRDVSRAIEMDLQCTDIRKYR